METAELSPALREIQAHADALGYSIHGLFVEAKVPANYWRRWVRGWYNPTLVNLEKLRAVQTGPAQPRASA